jgi:acyl-coenzyme A thioesterase PaaI-like protein
MFDKFVFEAIKKQMNATVPFAKHLALELVDIASGKASARLPDEKFNANHIGSQHAGALFAVADTASGAAVAAMFGQKILALRPVVKTAQVSFVKIARGAIVAKAAIVGDAKAMVKTVDKTGNVEVPVDVKLESGDGVMVAEMHFLWHVSKPTKA